MIKFGTSRDGAGFLLDPGLGKTVCTLECIRLRMQRKEVKRVLVVAKRRICYQVWGPEIEKWGYPFSYEVIHGKKDIFDGDSQIEIINYEGLEKFCDVKIKEFAGKKRKSVTLKPEFVGRYDMIVFDESSKLKRTNTQRFKIIRKLVREIKHRLILTGTPMPNNLIELFGQVFVLDDGATFGEYLGQFRNEYFYPSGYGGFTWKPVDGAEEKIFKKLKPLMIRFSDDELDMPPLTIVERFVDMGEESRKVYKEMEDDYLANVEAGIIVASNGAVASVKMRQICSGGIYMYKWNGDKERNERYTVHIHDEKTEECIEIVEELQGSPCMIAYEWGHDRERLEKAFPSAEFMDGSTSDAGAVDIERRWNAGEIPVLCGNIATISHGLNLQESGSTLIMYSLTYSWEDFDQLYRRLWRQGQKKHVRVIMLVMSDSIEEAVVASLQTKQTNQDAFLNAMEEKYKTKFQRKRRTIEMKKMTKKQRFDAIIRYFPNPQRPTYSGNTVGEVTSSEFLQGLIICIAGWMPPDHKEFLKACGVKTTAEEKLDSLMRKTRKTLFQVLGVDESRIEEDVYFKDDELVNDIINYYIEANDMADKAQSKFGGTKKKATTKKKAATKKAPAKKTAPKKEEPSKSTTKRKVVTKKTATKKAAPAGKKEVKSDLDLSATIVLGPKEKVPVMPARQEIVKLVPKGKRGVKCSTLVDKGVEATSLSEKRVHNHILAMIKIGFIAIK